MNKPETKNTGGDVKGGTLMAEAGYRLISSFKHRINGACFTKISEKNA